MFTHKTNRGRVVYDRKPKAFTRGAAHRVQAAVIRDLPVEALARFLEDGVQMSLQDVRYVKLASAEIYVDCAINILKVTFSELQEAMNHDDATARVAAFRLIEIVNIVGSLATPQDR